MSFRKRIKDYFIQIQDKNYYKLLAAKQMTYEEWIDLQEKTDIKSISASQEKDAFYVFHSKDGKLAEAALEVIADYFHRNPQVQIVYGDEDVWDQDKKERRSPWFKPEWSPETFQSFFYFGSVVAVKKEYIEERHSLEKGHSLEERHSLDDRNTFKKDIITYDILPGGKEFIKELVALANADSMDSQVGNIGHISRILFHSKEESFQKSYLDEAIEVKQKEIAQSISVRDKKTSVIILSKDNPDVLETCLSTLSCSVSNENLLEIIVVDNGSKEGNRERVQGLLEGLSICQTLYLYESMEFHFSKMCNIGAEKATGDILLFINDDMEFENNQWMEKMLSYAIKDHVGAVGLKLYYPDSKKIQHAGITNLPMGPVHKLQFMEDNKCYYYGRNSIDTNVLAVTGACLMVSKQKFEEAGGFSLELPVAFNDVDICFALYELGYYNVVVNSKYAFHHESLSRGDDESREKLKRLGEEKDKLYRRHPKLCGWDPYYPKGLNHDTLDTLIRPAFYTGRNQVQEGTWQENSKALIGYREDSCLLVRIENVSQEFIQGYGVVLGDDNSCYLKTLILKRENTLEDKDRLYYEMEVEGQYRPDLQENMADQTHVALCGFAVRYHNLPKGEYRVGMKARNKVTGTKLFCFSNRYIGI